MDLPDAPQTPWQCRSDGDENVCHRCRYLRELDMEGIGEVGIMATIFRKPK